MPQNTFDGVVKQQAISWTNIDLDLCHYSASLDSVSNTLLLHLLCYNLQILNQNVYLHIIP